MSQSELFLEYETAHFLHSLFGHDLKAMEDLAHKLGLEWSSRDGWIKFSGEEQQLELVKKVLGDLEQARRKGVEIKATDVAMALELAKQEGNKLSVSQLGQMRLQAGSGRKSVSPRNERQWDYLKAMEQNTIVFGLGAAGTGKTYLAMAMALNMLKRREIARIILTRPAVEAGEALGFLPGDLREKIAPYLRPLFDALHDMLGSEESARLMETGVIEIAPLAFMRGRTLSNAFVILDEAQNTTCDQMFMLLTRLGESSRMVVTGDPSQIDLRPKSLSGLREAQAALSAVEDIAFVNFLACDVVRHPVVARIVSAYANYRQSD